MTKIRADVLRKSFTDFSGSGEFEERCCCLPWVESVGRWLHQILPGKDIMMAASLAIIHRGLLPNRDAFSETEVVCILPFARRFSGGLLSKADEISSVDFIMLLFLDVAASLFSPRQQLSV